MGGNGCREGVEVNFGFNRVQWDAAKRSWGGQTEAGMDTGPPSPPPPPSHCAPQPKVGLGVLL